MNELQEAEHEIASRQKHVAELRMIEADLRRSLAGIQWQIAVCNEIIKSKVARLAAAESGKGEG